MKKNILILLFLSFILLFTGCSNKEEVVPEKGIDVFDEKTGYKVTFKKAGDFEVIDTDTDGKFVKVTLKNEKLNAEMEVYFFEILLTNYNSSKERRHLNTEYKDYKWNNYEAYAYNGNKYGVDYNILLNEDNGNVIGLFGTVTYTDYKTANVFETFNGEDFQAFMNSIVFEKK